MREVLCKSDKVKNKLHFRKKLSADAISFFLKYYLLMTGIYHNCQDHFVLVFDIGRYTVLVNGNSNIVFYYLLLNINAALIP